MFGGLVGFLSTEGFECRYFSSGSDGGRCPAGGGVEKVKKNKSCVLSFSVNLAKRPTGVRKKRKSRGKGTTGSCFWRLSLGNSYGLVKAMLARDTSKPAGSEARGEGRERGYFSRITSKPLPEPIGLVGLSYWPHILSASLYDLLKCHLSLL